MEDRLIRVEEVALVMGVNTMTIERWYKFKRENPDNEYVKLLPDFIYQTNSKNRQARYLRSSDIPALKKFQESIVLGTKGFMGSVTNPKRKENINGKKKVNRNRK